MKQDLLIEIGTEELPPKALKKLSKAFSDGITKGLKEARLTHADVTNFATPRRLAVFIKAVDNQQEAQQIERKGPAVKVAFDAEGNPTKAIQGFARSCGVEVADLEQQDTPKGAWFVFKKTEAGKPLAELLEVIVNNALQKLPTPKKMRWGAGSIEFVRPIHWFVCLLGDEVLNITTMGHQAGRETRGHRFHSTGTITLKTANDYQQQLNDAYVIADFAQRRDQVAKSAERCANELGGKVIIDPELLDEVTALVEWPVAVAGKFEAQFLNVPQECLITTMENHQKYFAVVDNNNQLMPFFITTSNIESKNVAKVSEGNERVIRPRFADAEFFWEQDKKKGLASYIASTQKIIFQKQLGTLYEKTQRVTQLAKTIAQTIGANVADAERATQLSKCDLMTNMVAEFPKLQGIMGRYYALDNHESENVAWALEEQYLPRFAGDRLPEHEAGKILALADRIDTLIGIVAIGMKPTGTKDPFSLRRAALAVLRIIIELKLDINLHDLLTLAANNLSDKVDAKASIDPTFNYIVERLKAYYGDQGMSADIVDAVAKLRPTRPLDFAHRVHAVAEFKTLNESSALAAANKRISNILKKQEPSNTIDTSLLTEGAEKQLHSALVEQQEIIKPLFASGDYTTALKSLAKLREPVDTFFDDVMVMVDDKALKNNRLALLSQLHQCFLNIADLSVLQ
ncbi:MAG: glycine--tRNA ligase subunit beta [Thiotrichaceae bacterium]|nr:glycine--tRNA ligase subunit beta [Thiotrichaceae bacterium]